MDKQTDDRKYPNSARREYLPKTKLEFDVNEVKAKPVPLGGSKYAAGIKQPQKLDITSKAVQQSASNNILKRTPSRSTLQFNQNDVSLRLTIETHREVISHDLSPPKKKSLDKRPPVPKPSSSNEKKKRTNKPINIEKPTQEFPKKWASGAEDTPGNSGQCFLAFGQVDTSKNISKKSEEEPNEYQNAPGRLSFGKRIEPVYSTTTLYASNSKEKLGTYPKSKSAESNCEKSSAIPKIQTKPNVAKLNEDSNDCEANAMKASTGRLNTSKCECSKLVEELTSELNSTRGELETLKSRFKTIGKQLKSVETNMKSSINSLSEQNQYENTVPYSQPQKEATNLQNSPKYPKNLQQFDYNEKIHRILEFIWMVYEIKSDTEAAKLMLYSQDTATFVMDLRKYITSLSLNCKSPTSLAEKSREFEDPESPVQGHLVRQGYQSKSKDPKPVGTKVQTVSFDMPKYFRDEGGIKKPEQNAALNMSSPNPQMDTEEIKKMLSQTIEDCPEDVKSFDQALTERKSTLKRKKPSKGRGTGNGPGYLFDDQTESDRDYRFEQPSAVSFGTSYESHKAVTPAFPESHQKPGEAHRPNRNAVRATDRLATGNPSLESCSDGEDCLRRNHSPEVIPGVHLFNMGRIVPFCLDPSETNRSKSINSRDAIVGDEKLCTSREVNIGDFPMSDSGGSNPSTGRGVLNSECRKEIETMLRRMQANREYDFTINPKKLSKESGHEKAANQLSSSCKNTLPS